MLVSRIKKGEVSKNQSRPARTRKNFSVKSVFSKRFCGGACIRTTIFYMQRYNSQAYRGYVHATDEAITKCSYVTWSNKGERERESKVHRFRKNLAGMRNGWQQLITQPKEMVAVGRIVSSIRKEFSLETEIIGGDVLSPIKLFSRLFE